MTPEKLASTRAKWALAGPHPRTLKGFWDPQQDLATRALPVRHYTPEEIQAFVPTPSKNIDWEEWAERTVIEQHHGVGSGVASKSDRDRFLIDEGLISASGQGWKLATA